MLPVSKEYYLNQFQTAKKYGFNYVRYHSSTPPREAFEAADEVGILLHVELAVMFSHWLMPNKELLSRELERILVSYRNHPSLFALAFGNEFNLERDFHTDAEKREFLATIDEFYRSGKNLAPHVFIMSNAGYPVFPSDCVAAKRIRASGSLSNAAKSWIAALTLFSPRTRTAWIRALRVTRPFPLASWRISRCDLSWRSIRPSAQTDQVICPSLSLSDLMAATSCPRTFEPRRIISSCA